MVLVLINVSWAVLLNQNGLEIDIDLAPIFKLSSQPPNLSAFVSHFFFYPGVFLSRVSCQMEFLFLPLTRIYWTQWCNILKIDFIGGHDSYKPQAMLEGSICSLKSFKLCCLRILVAFFSNFYAEPCCVTCHIYTFVKWLWHSGSMKLKKRINQRSTLSVKKWSV